METFDVSKGLKKMFVAQIGVVICTVLMIIPIINLLAVVGVLVFGIISIIGLSEAGRGLEGCKTAFTLTIVNLAVSVVSNYAGGGMIGGILSIAGYVLQFLIVYFVCTSVAGALRQAGSPEIADIGELVWKINLVCYAADIIIFVLSMIPLINIIAGIASILMMIVALVASILYMTFLYKSSAAL